MAWNWPHDDWPKFIYDRDTFVPNETQFIHEAEMVHVAIKHLTEEDKSQLTIDVISDEAVTTSKIEGRYSTVTPCNPAFAGTSGWIRTTGKFLLLNRALPP